MNKTLVTVGAVHTHIHTDVLLDNRNDKVACYGTRVGFVCDAQKMNTE